MATPKQITVSDIVMGTLYIDPVVGGVLPIKRNYTLVGTDQELLDAAGTFVLVRNPLWADVPQTVKDALLIVNNWTEQEILIDRGMV